MAQALLPVRSYPSRAIPRACAVLIYPSRAISGCDAGDTNTSCPPWSLPGSTVRDVPPHRDFQYRCTYSIGWRVRKYLTLK